MSDPVVIPPVPTPVPTAMDPESFDTRADALLSALPDVVAAMNGQNAQNNALHEEVTEARDEVMAAGLANAAANAATATTQAAAAFAHASAASASATTASAQASAASASATAASASATAASASAATASAQASAASASAAAAAASVARPSWAGKRNGWPDPFFRKVSLTGTFLGAVRFWKNTVGHVFTNTWSIVANAQFNGNAIRNTNVGGVVTGLSGPMIALADMGAGEGDTITVRVLGVPNGGNLIVPGYFTSAAVGGVIGAQRASLNESGGGSLVSGSGLGLLTFDLVVPAGAVYFATAPYVSAGSGDIVAMWAVKGAASSAPTWPTLSDPDYNAYTLADHETRIADNAAKVAANTPAITYAVESYGIVTASAEAVALAVTSPSTFPRDLTFRGWGEPYVPAGVSFNAVRIKTIGRTAALESSKWRTLNIMVRTGAGSHLNTATVVAVGSTTVLEDSDTLNNVTILLKDPVTGLPKTLNDANFSGGEYFIGVYASNAAGAPASCGEPRATQPNHLGSIGYYTTAANPLTGTWSAVTSGGPRQGFEHLLLTTPVEGVTYNPTPELSAAVRDTIAEVAPSIVKPPFIYGVQGKECNVYTRALHYGDETEYFHDFAGSYGRQQNERWTWIPAAALGAGNTLTYSVHNKRTGAQLDSHVMQLRAAAAAAGNGLNKKTLFIGDSWINGGVISQTMLDNAAGDVMGVTLYGTRGSGSNKHEGRGGWSINDYSTVGRTYYTFTVSGVVTPPAINSTTYTNNGNTYTVQELNLTGGAGTIVCSVSPPNGEPQASGTLTKVSGTGDASIAFSASAAVSGNPFWIGGAINFAQYLTNNGFPVMDNVFINLGVNDAFSQTTDASCTTLADTELTKLDTLIASIKASDANTKVFLMMTSPGADQDAFGDNYGSSQNWWRYKRNMAIWAAKMITKYSGQEASRTILVPSNVAWDTVSGQGTSTAARNARDSTSVARMNNSVHPATIGYQQIGDACWAAAKFYA